MPSGSSHGLQALHDELAGEVDVGAIFEGDGDLREPELRDGTHLLEAGQPGDGLLDREGDLLLDLEGRERRRGGVDLDLDRRRVGKRIDRQTEQRVRPRRRPCTSVSAMTRNRWFSDQVMMAFSIRIPLLGSRLRLRSSPRRCFP